MKKLLTLLGSVGLIASTSAAVVACGDKGTNTSSNTDNNGSEKPSDSGNPEVQPHGETENDGGMQDDKANQKISTDAAKLNDAKEAVAAAQKKVDEAMRLNKR